MPRKTFPLEAVRRSVQRLLDESGQKPKPLAEALGLGETAIRDIFLEKTKSVGGQKLAAIAAFYGVTVEDILAGTASTKIKKAQEMPGGFAASPPAISLPVTLPNAEALAEMFAALLELVDLDPDEDERARRLARSFPGAFQATVLPPAGQGSLRQKIRGALPHAGAEDQP